VKFLSATAELPNVPVTRTDADLSQNW